MARYFEMRHSIESADTTIAADVMRHFHARQYLGQAVIICTDPAAMAQAASRQWLKLARTLQRRRLAAADPSDILHYTHSITHMQHTEIVAGAPQPTSTSGVYVIRPEQLEQLPPDCISVYVAMELPDTFLPRLLAAMPHSSLLIDYYDQVQRGDFGLIPKATLEEHAVQRWQTLEAFLERRHININQLAASPLDQLELSNILDNLLEVSMQFLELANSLQHQLDIAQPLRNTSKAERERYALFARLAYHVQALTPGTVSTQFMRSYSDDSFFLRDHQRAHSTWQDLVAWHEQAGRHRLAKALAYVARGLNRADAGQISAATA